MSTGIRVHSVVLSLQVTIRVPKLLGELLRYEHGGPPVPHGPFRCFDWTVVDL